MTRRQYRIRVAGVLGDRFATAFDPFRLEREPGHTVLIGTCVDSSAVFGALHRVEAFGLELLAVESTGPPVEPHPESTGPEAAPG